MNPLHWVAFGITVVLMFIWFGTPLRVRVHDTFTAIGIDGGWSWPVCGLAAFWATYFALRLGVAIWSRRGARLDDI